MEESINTHFSLHKPREGNLYEKYIGELFELSGFDVAYNQRIKSGGITHEIDIIVKTPKGKIFIECKNVEPPFKKSLVDAFIGKLSDLETQYSSASFFIHLRSKKEEIESLNRYREYCKRKGIVFLDENEVHELKKEIGRLSTNNEKQEYLMDIFIIKPEQDLFLILKKNPPLIYGIIFMFVGLLFILRGSFASFFLGLILVVTGAIFFYYGKTKKLPPFLEAYLH